MVKTYRKGYVAELELVHILAKRGWLVVRAPRSGRINLPSPDIIAVKNGKIVAIECKVRDEAFSVSKDQIDQLKVWSKTGGASVFLALKVPRRGWKFFGIDMIIKMNGKIGKKSFNDGLDLEEFISLIDR